MPTRDDAAYSRHYANKHRMAVGFSSKSMVPALGCILRRWPPVQFREEHDAQIDAYTDILLERGLCASVLNWWHKKPAGDELEW